MSRSFRAALFWLALAALAIGLASAQPAPAPPGPEVKGEWRECEDTTPHVKRALRASDVCVDPFPILAGKPWSIDLALRHHGKHEIRAATMTLKVYALKHVLVYSTTQDFCRASKKKTTHEASAAAADGGFANMIARAAADDKKEEDEESGCPLRAGEEAMLHYEGEWSAWAPESDKYSIRVLVHSHERPHPTNELLCVDVDVVVRKPPSSSSSSRDGAVAAS